MTPLTFSLAIPCNNIEADFLLVSQPTVSVIGSKVKAQSDWCPTVLDVPCVPANV